MESNQGVPSRALADMPLGPKLRACLGIDAGSYRGHALPADEYEHLRPEFSKNLTERLVAEDFSKRTDLLVDVMDELVAMDMPDVVTSVYRAHSTLLPAGDFRALLAIAVAAMLSGDYDTAVAKFAEAQVVNPREPAPYVNIGKILLHRGNSAEAEAWIESGLVAQPNYAPMWELAAAHDQDVHGLDGAAERIRARAVSLDSWSGVSLAADLASPPDNARKAAWLSEFESHDSDLDYLVEYTGALGQAGDFAKIPTLVWRAEREAGKSLPWQLRVHCAQAHMAMNDDAGWERQMAAVLKDSATPTSVKEGLKALHAEARASH